jgi:hypothetical protein
MNTEKYPWLLDLASHEAVKAIEKAREQFEKAGVAIFHDFLTEESLNSCVKDAREQEDDAFTTDDTHTPYLKPKDPSLPEHSVYNHEMRTQVASVAFDELPTHSQLSKLYRNPTFLRLVSSIVQRKLFLSEDPLGCCSINVFRPNYHHSFHFDESEFSTTLMLQEASDTASGLFQYTHPLRQSSNDLALQQVAATIHEYDTNCSTAFAEEEKSEGGASSDTKSTPQLSTLDFRPGTLSIFSGSRSLHRVTQVKGNCSRLVAVLTFATAPGFVNTAKVQKLFWGRSSV